MKFKVKDRNIISNKGNIFSFQNASLKDLNQLVELENLCFSYDQLGQSKFKAFILKETSQLLVLKDDQKIIGYVLTLFRKNSNKCRIYSLCVHPEYSGQGLAGLIMGGQIDVLRDQKKFIQARLEVKDSNSTAIKIYERLGFIYSKTIEGFYSDGENALIYNIKL